MGKVLEVKKNTRMNETTSAVTRNGEWNVDNFL